MGPALPPLALGRAVALGGGVGVGVCGGVMGTSSGGGPGGVLVVLCPGGAWGAEAWARVHPWVRAHRLHFRGGLGSVVAAVAGHLLDVGRHRGLVGGWGRCCGTWRCSGPVGAGLCAWGVAFEGWWDDVRRASAAARSAMKVVAAVSVTVGGRCRALLLPGLGWRGPEDVEDVLGGLGLRCRRGAGLVPGLGLGSGLRPGCVDGLGWLLGGGLGVWPGCGIGLHRCVGHGGGGAGL